MCCFCTLVMSSWGNLAENTGAVLQLSANNEAGAFFADSAHNILEYEYIWFF